VNDREAAWGEHKLVAADLGLKLETSVVDDDTGRGGAQTRAIRPHAISKFIMAFASAVVIDAAGERFAASHCLIVCAREGGFARGWIEPEIDVCACALLGNHHRPQGIEQTLQDRAQARANAGPGGLIASVFVRELEGGREGGREEGRVTATCALRTHIDTHLVLALRHFDRPFDVVLFKEPWVSPLPYGLKRRVLRTGQGHLAQDKHNKCKQARC
jgi:hypothetical protein